MFQPQTRTQRSVTGQLLELQPDRKFAIASDNPCGQAEHLNYSGREELEGLKC